MVGTTTLNSGGTNYILESVYNHLEYDYTTLQNDITLLKTETAITGSSVVASIPIGSTTIGSGVAVTLSGWGLTAVIGSVPNNLQFINLRTIDNVACAERVWAIFSTSLCTFTQAGEGACYGDSGGPLVANGVLVGLVSFGRPYAIGFPDIFTRISSYVDLIQENAT